MTTWSRLAITIEKFFIFNLKFVFLKTVSVNSVRSLLKKENHDEGYEIRDLLKEFILHYL